VNALRLTIAALLAALVLAACGDDSDTGASTSPTDSESEIAFPSGEDELVVRVELVGGYEVGPAADDQPLISVYGQGLAIAPGPQIEIYPPPALPNLQTTSIGTDGVENLVQEADELGLLTSDIEYGEPEITDQPETVVTIAADGEVYQHRAYALDFVAPTGGLIDDEQAAARANLLEFVQLATGSEVLGGDALGGYEYEEMAVVSEKYSAPDGNERPRPNTIEWPLGNLATEGERFEFGGRCSVVSGADLELVVELAGDATTITRWISDAKPYSLMLIPLLPDEHSCDNLLPV
jgi:hypothetical protein